MMIIAYWLLLTIDPISINRVIPCDCYLFDRNSWRESRAVDEIKRDIISHLFDSNIATSKQMTEITWF